MSENKTFQLAFLVSVLIHSLFFLSLPYTPFLSIKRPLENLAITYYRIEERPEIKRLLPKKEDSVIKKLPEVTKEEILDPPRPAAKKIEKTKPKTRDVTAVERKEEKRFETVVEEEKDDAKKAIYISYYKAVREKIKYYADRNYPRNRNLREGGVFLTFTVASSGELLQVSVRTEKSIDDSLLRNIAINSIRDASPFPSFPSGMNQYQITFNVVIAFEQK